MKDENVSDFVISRNDRKARLLPRFPHQVIHPAIAASKPYRHLQSFNVCDMPKLYLYPLQNQTIDNARLPNLTWRAWLEEDGANRPEDEVDFIYSAVNALEAKMDAEVQKSGCAVSEGAERRPVLICVVPSVLLQQGKSFEPRDPRASR